MNVCTSIQYIQESIHICSPKRERGLPEDGCSYEATERGMERGMEGREGGSLSCTGGMRLRSPILDSSGTHIGPPSLGKSELQA